MDWVDRPQTCKGLYGILQLLQGSHLDNFALKTVKLGWVDFQSNQYKKVAPALSRFWAMFRTVFNIYEKLHKCFLSKELPKRHF